MLALFVACHAFSWPWLSSTPAPSSPLLLESQTHKEVATRPTSLVTKTANGHTLWTWSQPPESTGSPITIAWRHDFTTVLREQNISRNEVMWGRGECGPLAGAWATVVYMHMDDDQEERNLMDLFRTALHSFGLANVPTPKRIATCWIAPRLPHSNGGYREQDVKDRISFKRYQGWRMKLSFTHDVFHQLDNGAFLIFMDSDVVVTQPGILVDLLQQMEASAHDIQFMPEVPVNSGFYIARKTKVTSDFFRVWRDEMRYMMAGDQDYLLQLLPGCGGWYCHQKANFQKPDPAMLPKSAPLVANLSWGVFRRKQVNNVYPPPCQRLGSGMHILAPLPAVYHATHTHDARSKRWRMAGMFRAAFDCSQCHDGVKSNCPRETLRYP
jgi:hypothetical protein